MAIPSDFVEETAENGAVTLHFSGDLSIASIGDLPERLRDYGGDVSRLDIADTGYIDTVGAWLIHRSARDMDAEIIGANDDAQRLIAAVAGADQPTDIRPEQPNPVLRVLNEVGEATTVAFTTLTGLVGFLGAIMVGFFRLLRHPGKIRWNAVIQRFDVVGRGRSYA